MKKPLCFALLCALLLLSSCAQTPFAKTEDPSASNGADVSSSVRSDSRESAPSSAPSDSPAPESVSEESAPSDSGDAQKTVLFDHISFENSSYGLDDDGVSLAEYVRRIKQAQQKLLPGNYTFCLVTPLNVDLQWYEYDFMGNTREVAKPFVEVRIDRIFAQTEQSPFHEGDTLTLSMYNNYRKAEDGLVIDTGRYMVPLSEIGSQYVAEIYHRSPVSSQEEADRDKGYEYRAHVLTIPLNQNANMTKDEIYRYLGVSEDFIPFSEGLIDYLINGNDPYPDMNVEYKINFQTFGLGDLTFTPVPGEAELPSSAEDALNYPKMHNDSSRGLCVCSAWIGERYPHIQKPDGLQGTPVQIQVDRIFSQNDACTLRDGQYVLGFDQTVWERSGEDHTVCFEEGSVPVTVYGARYVLLIEEVPHEDGLSTDEIPVRFTALSLPKAGNLDLTPEEMCAALSLSEQTSERSKELLALIGS